MKLNTIIQGDCLEELKKLPDESIDMVITSPPYWALRDYGTATWVGGDKKCNHQIGRNTRGGLSGFQKNNKGSFGDEAIKNGENCPKCGAKRVDLQLGLEPTFQEYVNKLCDIFDEVKRVLKKSGTCWVNMGDTYGGTGAGQERSPNSKGKFTDGQYFEQAKSRELKSVATKKYSKCLLQIPSRFSIEMVNRGWILRNEIIWHKPNCMPSSIKDRFTVDFEKIFFFTKNKKYWFEQQRESSVGTWNSHKMIKNTGNYKNAVTQKGGTKRPDKDQIGRNKRCIWAINPKGYKEAHFAVYPEKLIETPIKAGCPKKGIVLDIFMGSGTTAVVARNLGRNYLGIELNPKYIEIAKKRLGQELLL